MILPFMGMVIFNIGMIIPDLGVIIPFMVMQRLDLHPVKCFCIEGSERSALQPRWVDCGVLQHWRRGHIEGIPTGPGYFHRYIRYIFHLRLKFDYY